MSVFSDGWQGIEGEGTEYRVYIDGNTTALYTLILIILNITAAAIAMKIVPEYVIQCCDKSPSAPFKLHDPLTSLYCLFGNLRVFISTTSCNPRADFCLPRWNIRRTSPSKAHCADCFALALHALPGAIYTSKQAKDLHVISGLKYLCWGICCFRKIDFHIRMANSLSMWDILVFLLWGIDAIVAMTVTAIVYPYAIFFTLCLFLSSWLFLMFFAFVRHNTHLLLANHRSFVDPIPCRE